LAEFTSNVGMKRLELLKEAVPRAGQVAFGSANLWVQPSAGRRPTLRCADEVIQ
jgi:hypothetical protein